MNEVTLCQSRKGFKPNYRILYTEQESERGQWTSEASSHSRVVLVSFASANSGKFSALWGLWVLHRAWLHWCTFPRNCSESSGTIQTNQLHRRLYLCEPIGARVILISFWEMAHFKAATFLLHLSSLPRHSVRTCSLFQAKRALYISSIMKRSLDYSTSESGAPNSLDYRMYFRKYNYFRSCVVECINLELLFPVARYGEWIVVDRWKFFIFVDFLPFANWMFDLLLKKFDVEIWWLRFSVLKQRWSNSVAYRLAHPGSCEIMLHLLSSRAVNFRRLASLNVEKRTKNHPKYMRWTGIGEKVVEIPQFWGGQDY